MGMKPNFKVSKRFHLKKQVFRNSFSVKDNDFETVSVSIYVFR